MNAPPEPPVDHDWSRGSRTIAQAADETGLSKRELVELCDQGILPWFRHGGRETRIVAWGPLTDLLKRLHAEFLAGTGART